MILSVCPSLVGWLVGRLVGPLPSVIISWKAEVSIPCSYRSTCYIFLLRCYILCLDHAKNLTGPDFLVSLLIIFNVVAGPELLRRFLSSFNIFLFPGSALLLVVVCVCVCVFLRWLVFPQYRINSIDLDIE